MTGFNGGGGKNARFGFLRKIYIIMLKMEVNESLLGPKSTLLNFCPNQFVFFFLKLYLMTGITGFDKSNSQ